MGCCDWLEFFRDWRHARIYLPKAITSVSLLVFIIFMNFSSGGCVRTAYLCFHAADWVHLPPQQSSTPVNFYICDQDQYCLPKLPTLGHCFMFALN